MLLNAASALKAQTAQVRRTEQKKVGARGRPQARRNLPPLERRKSRPLRRGSERPADARGGKGARRLSRQARFHGDARTERRARRQKASDSRFELRRSKACGAAVALRFPSRARRR